jgi:hypothetical protein
MQTRAVENPFASPHTNAGQSAYYRTDLSKLSYRELRRMAPNYLVFLLAVVFAKVLRMRGKVIYGVAYEAARIVELPQLAPESIESLEAKLHECEAQGFVRRFGMTVPMVGAIERASVMLSNRDRTILAECIYIRVLKRLEIVVALVSKLADGRVLVTKDGRHGLDPPPAMVTVDCTGAAVADLFATHQARLRQLRNVRALVLDDVAQRQLLLDNTQYICEYGRERGVFMPLTNAEVERLTAAEGAQ